MKRDCNFEVLRTISMFLIVVYHFCTHGIGSSYLFNCHDSISVFNLLFCDTLLVLSSICVNLFILISGFFLLYAEFKFSRIIRTWFLTCFYSFFLTLVFYLFSSRSVNLVSLIKSCFPLSTDYYWFVTQYIGLLLLSPFLGMLARIINRQQYIFLLIICGFICLSLVPDFPLGKRFHVAHGNSLQFFSFLFLIAGYIRRFVEQVSVLFIAKSIVVVIIVILLWSIYLGRNHLFWLDYNSLPVILSVLVFILFKQVEVESFCLTRPLVKIAPYTFSVYLIHDHLIIRDWLWSLLHLQTICDKLYFPVIVFVVCASIFFVGICVDWIRKRLFDVCGINNLILRIDNLVHFPKD